MGRKALLRDIHGKGARHHKAYATGATGHIRVATKDLESPELEVVAETVSGDEPVDNKSENVDEDVFDIVVDETEAETEEVEESEESEESEEEVKAKPAKKKGRRKKKKKD